MQRAQVYFETRMLTYSDEHSYFNSKYTLEPSINFHANIVAMCKLLSLFGQYFLLHRQRSGNDEERYLHDCVV